MRTKRVDRSSEIRDYSASTRMFFLGEFNLLSSRSWDFCAPNSSKLKLLLVSECFLTLTPTCYMSITSDLPSFNPPEVSIF
jgi:hypothetical protein